MYYSPKIHSRSSLQDRFLQKKKPRENLDRLIPNRSAMDLDYAHYVLTEGRKGKENPSVWTSPSRAAYQKQLADALNTNRTRILAFKNKPPASVDPIPHDLISPPSYIHHSKSVKSRRYIPQEFR